MNGRQFLFVIGITLAVIILIAVSVVFIHGSWPNLTSMTAIPNCINEIVGNCTIIK